MIEAIGSIEAVGAIAVVIAVRNEAERLPLLLADLYQGELPLAELVVVDTVRYPAERDRSLKTSISVAARPRGHATGYSDCERRRKELETQLETSSRPASCSHPRRLCAPRSVHGLLWYPPTPCRTRSLNQMSMLVSQRGRQAPRRPRQS